MYNVTYRTACESKDREIADLKAKLDNGKKLLREHMAITDERTKEIFTLRDKLDKAKYGLKDIAKQYKSTEWEEEGDTEYGYDMIIERARTTLEEI